ncbi:acyl-CoA dehydrogenase [Pseudomonas synxantha]|uniref:Acyl-CoA dehydrogenase n=1 Tax=Pseudomonas synxantha TaxID=47883 RepID=A0ABS0UNR3_9PSED|nr:acyl-CoA dehydrogenase [Pseudomonas synxantha]MBI6566215.1 acyl-CoA dehydrogenase [Pseudomonas synxantha]MBI6584603.1 acyl-CoA dehydrogenase [Pseudomonas synxantha]MBI6646754.1 acyl-CoA dehydrogenase [Pseudomonas synxantha]
MDYTAPLKDMLFNIEHLAGLDSIVQLDGFEDAGIETIDAVLAQCAKFNQEVIAPLNAQGDRDPAVLVDGCVKTTPGFREAFKQFADAGWLSVQHPVEFGGQGLPSVVGTACSEMANAANLSFSLSALLTDSAIAALMSVGDEKMKQTYLHKLVSGQWTGTMTLTEPQAGSDLSLIRTRAEPQGEGRYKLFGTKIFITYGDHDLAENIIHLMLARIPGAPAGVKGISMFLVPKILVREDGSLGERNDVHAVSLEHKLGIKASPTAVMQYGDNGGATGFLIGEENRGLEYMFMMMNSARFTVGVQGVAIAERAYQQALAYARERIQSRAIDGSSLSSVAIIHHPDVRRMLMDMRSRIEGCRAMVMVAATANDLGQRHIDATIKQAQHEYYEFLLPLIKGYCTEMSLYVTSLGIQVHGGMGFIEETGAAQYYRDARILPIYEGTTAIQANDLVGRKTVRDGGAFARSIAGQIEETEAQLGQLDIQAARSVLHALGVARKAFLKVVDYMVSKGSVAPNSAYAGSVAYLMMAGELVAGWQLARGLISAHRCMERGIDTNFMQSKISTAQYFAEHILTLAPAHCDRIIGGAESVMAILPEDF